MSNYLLAIIQLKDQVDHSESAAADKVLDRVSFGGLQRTQGVGAPDVDSVLGMSALHCTAMSRFDWISAAT
ncbi:hypothetical protein SNOG_01548 [Parastagonospora nodorum SN15]|uniref:Uncharacterized protein n=1 Tax=Phaeosphaeria nodorum (strain SN15 / ATCC MYA-4574 / FGSC 10173) TaxID=321614 RepID=Q0V366_PHANO|nr:hypothetical protein SNOG_01548 [Parastagonospora nodorum SN15]EAT91197.1 hypothetical protein SNOG_01548 [Parastagonospora nodorum SN15]